MTAVCTLIISARADGVWEICGRPATASGRCARHLVRRKTRPAVEFYMTDRMLIPVSAELQKKLSRVAEGDQLVIDELVERALQGDPATWRKPEDPAPRLQPGASPHVICPCCLPGPCKHQFAWRGQARCDCDPSLAPGAGRPRVIQPDLERE